jgi:hypothetical protein
LIEDGINGFGFENQNAQSLAQAIDRLLSMSAPARAQLAQAGQAAALRALDPAANARLRLVAYQEAIAKPAQAPLPEDDWLRLAAAPRNGEAESLDFLDFVPLRGLIGYAARRLLRKLGA